MKYHRFYPVSEVNDVSGYVADDEIEEFEYNYKFKQFKQYEKEIAEFIVWYYIRRQKF